MALFASLRRRDVVFLIWILALVQNNASGQLLDVPVAQTPSIWIFTSLFNESSCRNPMSSSGPAIPILGTSLNCTSSELVKSRQLGKCIFSPTSKLWSKTTCTMSPSDLPGSVEDGSTWVTGTVYSDKDCTQAQSLLSFSEKSCVSLSQDGRPPFATFFCYPAPHYDPFPPGSGIVMLYTDNRCRNLLANQTGLHLHSRYKNINDSSPICQNIGELGAFNGYCGLARRELQSGVWHTIVDPGQFYSNGTHGADGSAHQTPNILPSPTPTTSKAVFATFVEPPPTNNGGISVRAVGGDQTWLWRSLVGVIAITLL